jgi:hypothetical protein
MANLTGATAAAFPTSETVGTSVAAPALGSRWRDTSGNEYVIVDCQEAFVAGEPVYIDSANLATQLTTDVAGRVGVIVASVSASDTKAYAQIYGLYAGAAGTSAVATSRYLTQVATTDMGAFGGVDSSGTGQIVHGAYAVTAAASDTTSPASSFVSAAGTSTTNIGFSVWLNYPYGTT